MDEIRCDRCDKVLEVGDFPFCPHPHQANSVIGDDIPGGIAIRHGLCNEDGTPRKYYSKSEMRREAERRGLVNYVTHTPDPKSGSDKSKFTSRWI